MSKECDECLEHSGTEARITQLEHNQAVLFTKFDAILVILNRIYIAIILLLLGLALKYAAVATHVKLVE